MSFGSGFVCGTFADPCSIGFSRRYSIFGFKCFPDSWSSSPENPTSDRITPKAYKKGSDNSIKYGSQFKLNPSFHAMIMSFVNPISEINLNLIIENKAGLFYLVE